MRIHLTIIFLLLSFPAAFAQTGYVSVKDSATGQKIFQGIISEEILIKEDSFGWMKMDLSSYQPDSLALNLIANNKDSLHLLIFLGTWCEDSQQIIPKIFKLLQKAKLPHNKISILGVDKQKKTLGNFSDGFNVSRVPTIIVLKKGEEIGRIIEYGKYGNIEKDLIEMLTHNSKVKTN